MSVSSCLHSFSTNVLYSIGEMYYGGPYYWTSGLFPVLATVSNNATMSSLVHSLFVQREPYLWDGFLEMTLLKGQMQLEFGRCQNPLPSYKAAHFVLLRVVHECLFPHSLVIRVYCETLGFLTI